MTAQVAMLAMDAMLNSKANSKGGAMNMFLTVGVLAICASAIVAAATMQVGMLLASLTALVVVAWAVVLQELLDK